jgi:hypothetical protein
MPKSTFYNANLSASTKTANILSGDVNEFVPYPAMVRLTAVSSAIGVRMSVFADSDLLVDDKEIPFIGTSLIDKDHVVDEFAVEAGTRLAVFYRETAAAATTDVYLGVEIQPL